MARNWPVLDPRDLAACGALLRSGSKSFHAASLLLPPETRRPATALYAFCRIADDVIDGTGGGPDAVEALRLRVEAAYRGEPADHYADRAFAAVVQAIGLPPEVPLALIDGFAWDASGRRYETYEDICAYAARVAGTVGVMMATVMGQRTPDLLARAADLGVAMQLTNIARDVGEDALRGRLYLPQAWLRAEGIDPEAFLRSPAHSPALARVVTRLLDAADELYARADAGIARLPARCRRGIRAARLIYAEIGREVRRQGCDSVSRRAIVPGSRKVALLLQATATAPRASPPLAQPPLPATAYLVEAVRVAAHPLRPPVRIQPAAWWDMPARAIAVIDMFDRLARVDRQAVRS